MSAYWLRHQTVGGVLENSARLWLGAFLLVRESGPGAGPAG